MSCPDVNSGSSENVTVFIVLIDTCRLRSFRISVHLDMPKVIIKYKNGKALKALQDLAKAFDMVIEKPAGEKHSVTDLPIRFADKPDANALSGIWKDKPVTIEELRKKAWGNLRL